MTRDRRVYLASHPLLFVLLALARRRAVHRFGDTVFVHSATGVRDALTTLPLDRSAAGTVGAAARGVLAENILFDQYGLAHRRSRHALAEDLGTAAITRLRPTWQAILDRRLAPLAAGEYVDIVDVVTELAGATVCGLLQLDVDAYQIAGAARAAAAAGVRAEFPGPGQRARRARIGPATARLTELVRDSPIASEGGVGLASMLAIAAVTTTVSSMPRAVQWCADEQLWAWADDDVDRRQLVEELLRVVAPVPVMSRVAAADGTVDGHPVRAGDRLLLIARHALQAHRRPPDRRFPAPLEVTQLAFGVGPHACPGATLARAQLADLLRRLAPLRPIVVRAKAERRGALPGWAMLTIAGRRWQ